MTMYIRRIGGRDGRFDIDHLSPDDMRIIADALMAWASFDRCFELAQAFRQAQLMTAPAGLEV